MVDSDVLAWHLFSVKQYQDSAAKEWCRINTNTFPNIHVNLDLILHHFYVQDPSDPDEKYDYA